MCNYALCHLSHDDGQVDLSLMIIPIKLLCMLYGQFTRGLIILICD
jgi:hypothetical protein